MGDSPLATEEAPSFDGDLFAFNSSVTVLITLPTTIIQGISLKEKLTVADLDVADFLLLEEVLHHDLVNLFDGFRGKLV